MAAESTYESWIGETICEALSEGHSLLSICEAMGIAYSTAMGWEERVPEHVANAARAREIGCRHMAEEMQRIADTPVMGVVKTVKQDGSVEERHEDMTQHRRLQIETRKWLLSKWASKIYGDRQQIDHNVTADTAAILMAARKRSGKSG